MSASAANVSVWDNLIFNLFHVVPFYLRGSVTARPRWVALLTKIHPDLAAVRFFTRMREKYKSEYLYLYVFEIGSNRLPRMSRTLVVLNPASIKEIYNKPDIFALDAKFKRERLSLFQPDSLTISSGEPAIGRRRFNEAVLNTGKSQHEYAHRFLDIVNEETDRLLVKTELVWDDFSHMAERVTQKVILGVGAIDVDLTRALEGMIRKSTRAFRFGRTKGFDVYYEKLDQHLRQPAAESLVFLCAHTKSTDETRVASQMTHWLFTMKDALETHVPRALALISAHPDVLERLREELAYKDLNDPEEITKLELLTGCAHEATRLWSVTPFLFRRTTVDTRLGDIEIPPETQILIHIASNQRDIKHYGELANQFAPEQWTGGKTPDPSMNHFNNGPRICAGRDLILFLITAVLARLLEQHRCVLRDPELQCYGRLPHFYNHFAIQFSVARHEPIGEDERFDYIVVGSGAGGGPLAANLAKEGLRVLLLEAGSDDSRNIHSQVPAFHPRASEDPDLAWNYGVRHYQDPQQQLQDSKAAETADGPRILYPRAATLGGCTVHSAMITICPHNSDWDYIAELTDDPSWRSENMRKYFQQLEQCRYRWGSGLGRLLRVLTFEYLGRAARHGYQGWLPIERAKARLLVRDWALLRIIYEAFEQVVEERRGYLILRLWKTLRNLLWGLDPNDWRRLKERAEGILLVPVSTNRGQRSSPRDYLNRIRSQYPNLIVRTDALVTSVLIDNGDEKRAVGVTYQTGARLYSVETEVSNVEAETHAASLTDCGEVILCAGAFNTPQLLMLSGIGPTEELNRLEIPVRVPLSGVGANLQDRYEISVVTRMKDDFPILDSVTLEPDSSDSHYFDWQSARKGLYATSGVVIGLTKRSKPSYPDPDLLIFGGPGHFKGYEPGYSKTLARSLIDGRFFSWIILKGDTGNRGRLTLKSKNPRDAPDINFSYFDDNPDIPHEESEDDLDSLVEGIHFVRRMNADSGLQQYVNEECVPGDHVNDKNKLKTFIKNEAWGHHASSTCKMGPKEDPMAVVDSEFRVHGTSNLRVVDASVFPRIPGLFIVSAVFMISEKAADIIIASRMRG